MKTPPVAAIDPHIAKGITCFTGTNIPIGTLFESIVEGMNVDQIIDTYPGLTRRAICMALGEAQRFIEMGASRSSSVLDWEPDSPLGKAVAAGNIYKAKKLREKQMLPAWKVAAMTGIDIDRLHRDAKDGRVIALSISDRGPKRFPAWQFDERYRNLVSDVILALDQYDSWGKYLFFIQQEPLLGAKVPLSKIQSGRGDEVLKVAKILNEDC